jgi:methyl-accepting chemotaxis protein
MEIASDAPMGTWTYFFYDLDSEELMNGTIEVGPSTAAQVDALLEDVREDLIGISDDVANLGGEFDALSDEIGDVSTDMDNLRDNIVGDLADDIADATAAASAAGDAIDDLEGSLDDLGDSIGDIADTANDALDAATSAADAADTAASAAEEASTAASGLTTLVYGAIGASLIAALAAIVSLMQISRRIAG